MILKSLLYSAVKPLPINLVYNQSSPVLLYHSIGKETDFKRNIDHIDLDFLENHIRELKKKWKFVSIDEYSQASSKKGLASITIDDGYKNIINEAISVFENYNIPITIFINSATFNGYIFWRDKIRYIIQHNLVKEFIKHSKNPKYNSKHINDEIDTFFKKKNISLAKSLCFDSKKYLIKHPLISYGNHTVHHYVLSSLNGEQQFDEICECQNYIKSYNINLSNIFSIPFGGRNTFNKITEDIIKELGFNGVLLSENKLNRQESSFYIDRFMLRECGVNKIIKYLFLKQFLKNKLKFL